MAKQAIKKGAGIQKRGLSAWKERNGMVTERTCYKQCKQRAKVAYYAQGIPGCA